MTIRRSLDLLTARLMMETFSLVSLRLLLAVCTETATNTNEPYMGFTYVASLHVAKAI